MNKNLINIGIIILLIALIPILFQNYEVLGSLTSNISLIFLTKVFPFLFVMMILNNLLIKMNFPYYLSKLTPNPYFYLFIMSAFSGSPVNAQLIASFIDDNLISEKGASIALSFTTLNNPLFLYSYFMLIFRSAKITLKLFLFIYLGNILIYFLFSSKLNNNFFTLCYKKEKFSESLIDSIKKSTNSLIMIFGIITFFYIFTHILIQNNSIISIIIKGFIEITQGLIALSTANISLKIKELLTLIVLNFAGLSIHMQISLILNKYHINYKYFYLSRFILILISFFSLL